MQLNELNIWVGCKSLNKTNPTLEWMKLSWIFLDNVVRIEFIIGTDVDLLKRVVLKTKANLSITILSKLGVTLLAYTETLTNSSHVFHFLSDITLTGR